MEARVTATSRVDGCWAAGNSQAHAPSATTPPQRIKNRRRQ